MASFSLDRPAFPAGYGEAILPLDEAKLHLRVVSDDEDALIEALRDASIDQIERYCSLSFGQRAGWTWQGAPGCMNSGAPLRLGCYPIGAITSISSIDCAGTSVIANPSDFIIGPHDQIRPAPGKRWPDSGGGATIVFTAGYSSGAASSKIPALVHAVRNFIEHLYENRDGQMGRSSDGDIPPAIASAISRHRLPTL